MQKEKTIVEEGASCKNTFSFIGLFILQKRFQSSKQSIFSRKGQMAIYSKTHRICLNYTELQSKASIWWSPTLTLSE